MTVPGLLGPKPFRPGTPRPGRFGPFFDQGLLGQLKWDRSAHFFIYFLGGGGGGGGGGQVIVSFCLCASKQEALFNVTLIFRQGNREII